MFVLSLRALFSATALSSCVKDGHCRKSNEGRSSIGERLIVAKRTSIRTRSVDGKPFVSCNWSLTLALEQGISTNLLWFYLNEIASMAKTYKFSLISTDQKKFRKKYAIRKIRKWFSRSCYDVLGQESVRIYIIALFLMYVIDLSHRVDNNV